MNFPNLPESHNWHRRAALTCAVEELRYYQDRVWEKKWDGGLFDRVADLLTEIEAATPETAAELFTKAWHLCRDMENILKCR